MNIVGVKFLREGLGDSYLQMMRTLGQSRAGLKDMGVNPDLDFASGKHINPKFSQSSNLSTSNRLGTEIHLICFFGKTQQDVLQKTADTVKVTNKRVAKSLNATRPVPIYQTFNNSTNILKYSYTDRNLVLNTIELHLLNVVQKVEAGKVYEIDIVKIIGFDQTLAAQAKQFKYFVLNEARNTNQYSRKSPW